ncbi:hypothetical protein ASPU41_18070 [Arthrobacter sp. U41]|nr:hypothetical protein ASPU41_18070 [Arthrobacter sp. U41]
MARPDQPRMVIKGRPWTWHAPDAPDEAGVALVIATSRVVQFLTPEQAITLADQLVDAAESQTHNHPTGHTATNEGTES